MYKYFAICLATVFLASCDSATTGPSTQQGAIMPLAVGNTWVYKVSILNNDGSTGSSYFDTVKIINSMIYNGDSIFAFNHGTAGKLNDEGYSIAIFGSDNFQLFAKYPTATGEIFRRDTLTFEDMDSLGNIIFDTSLITFFCKENPSSISVPAGSYSAVQYQYDVTSLHADFQDREVYYYAPGIGEVYSYSYSWSNGLVPFYKRELVSVDLK